MRSLQLIGLLLFSLLLHGCGEGAQKKQKLELAVGQVQRILNMASRDPMAAATLQSNVQMGGNLITYVMASLPDKFNYALEQDKPTRPWSIVIRTTADPHVVQVEGYAEDLKKPLFTQNAKIGPPPPGSR